MRGGSAGGSVLSGAGTGEAGNWRRDIGGGELAEFAVGVGFARDAVQKSCPQITMHPKDGGSAILLAIELWRHRSFRSP